MSERPISRIAFGACNDQDAKNNLWPIIESRQPAAFVWGGDAIYAGTYLCEVRDSRVKPLFRNYCYYGVDHCSPNCVICDLLAGVLVLVMIFHSPQIFTLPLIGRLYHHSNLERSVPLRRVCMSFTVARMPSQNTDVSSKAMSPSSVHSMVRFKCRSF